jgi:hypothetical protein
VMVVSPLELVEVEPPLLLQAERAMAPTTPTAEIASIRRFNETTAFADADPVLAGSEYESKVGSCDLVGPEACRPRCVGQSVRASSKRSTPFTE